MFATSGLLCAFHAFGNLPLAEVYALVFSAPILITPPAIPILGERVRAFRRFAIALGMAGVLVVLRPGASAPSAGHAAALGAALSIASAAVITRRIAGREHGLTLILYPLLGNVVVAGVGTARARGLDAPTGAEHADRLPARGGRAAGPARGDRPARRARRVA